MQPVQRRLDLRHQRFVVGLDAREPVAFLARVVHVNVGAREALRRGRKVRAVTPAARAARARAAADAAAARASLSTSGVLMPAGASPFGPFELSSLAIAWRWKSRE